MVRMFQVLTMEWWVMQDGSPEPSNFSGCGDWTQERREEFKQSMDTILLARGVDPVQKGWVWKDTIDRTIYGSIGYLNEPESTWGAALHRTSWRMTFPWQKGSPHAELQLNEEERKTVAEGQLIKAISLVRDRFWLSYPAGKRMVEDYIKLCKHYDKPIGSVID